MAQFRGRTSQAEPREAPDVAPDGNERAVGPAESGISPAVVTAFAVLCVLCLAVAAGYAALALQNDRVARNLASLPAALATPSAEPAPEVVAADVATVASLLPKPHLLFQDQVPADPERRVAVVPLDSPTGPRYRTSLACDRVYAAAGAGICLRADAAGLSTDVSLLDENLTPVHRLKVGGVPSRARISPDGRLAAFTVFVGGDSYSSDSFSTRTYLVDVARGTLITDLEKFAVTRDGRRFDAADFNYWGVTFARDGNRLYATLASGGAFYLIEGDVAARTARVLADRVECPSLSPDQTRIAYKARFAPVGGGPPQWHVAVLDLQTLQKRTLQAETHSVDDQIEWLDDGHLLYARPEETADVTDLWALPADGSGSPVRLLRWAASPAVAR